MTRCCLLLILSMGLRAQSFAIWPGSSVSGSNTTIITVPANVSTARVSITATASASPLNIANVVCTIEISGDGGQTWFLQDVSRAGRTLSQANTAFTMFTSARMHNVAGRLLRMTFDSGQMPVNLSVTGTITP